MSTFTDPSASPAPPPASAAPIQGDAFFPAIDAADFQAVMRIGSPVTPARVRQAVLAAMIEIEGDADLQQRKAQWAATSATLAAVPAPIFDGESRLVFLYRRAVYCAAKAILDEQYRDAATTPTGDRRGEALEPTVSDHRRDARWALSDLVGRPRVTVELI